MSVSNHVILLSFEKERPELCTKPTNIKEASSFYVLLCKSVTIGLCAFYNVEKYFLNFNFQK